MNKERFSTHRRAKLHPRGDRPFQILEKINDSTYKMDILGKYNVPATFNISNLYPFNIGEDSRSNSFKEKENDVHYGGPSLKYPLQVLDELMTKSKSKKIKEIMQGLVKFT